MACILIIDDDALFRQVVGRALVQVGHSILEAGDGRSAADLLRRLRVDLVLTDLVMPNGDGIEVIGNIRLQENPVPVIAMTGYHTETELYSGVAVQIGAQRVLMKPFTMDELLTVVDEVLLAIPAEQ